MQVRRAASAHQESRTHLIFEPRAQLLEHGLCLYPVNEFLRHDGDTQRGCTYETLAVSPSAPQIGIRRRCSPGANRGTTVFTAFSSLCLSFLSVMPSLSSCVYTAETSRYFRKANFLQINNATADTSMHRRALPLFCCLSVLFVVL